MEGFTAEYDYDYLTIYLIYDNQVNTTLFDGIQLYREALYSEYEYVEEDSTVGDDESDESDNETATDVEEVDTYDEYDRLIKSVSDENIVTNISYDDFNNEITTSTTNGTKEISTGTTYTTDGNYILSQTDEVGNTLTYGYDTLGNMVSMVNPLGNKTTYTYDSAGNVTGNSLAVSGLTNGTTISNSFTYDSGDRLTSITHNGFSYDFEYDSLGLLTNVLFNNEVRFKYAYDLKGNKAELYDYVNDIKKYYTTDSNGNEIVTEKGINGNDAYHSYYTSTDTTEVTATRPVTGTEYTKYNSTSVFHETIGSKLFETTYTEDGDGRLTDSLWSDDKGAKNLAITYDDLNRKSHTTLKSNSTVILNTVYDYKDVNVTKTTNFIEAIRLSNSNGYSKSLTYAYDANGNITNASGVTYVYDEAGQLVRVNDPANGTTTFQYDKGGNLVYEKTYAYATGTLGSVTSTKQYSYQYDRLVSVTENGVTTSITYDVSGNPLTYHNGMEFKWEMGRQLAGITNGNTTISYTYNEDGIRTSKTVNGVTTEYTLVDGRITYQTNGTTSMYFRYDGDNELTGFEYTVNGVTNEYYYVKNLQGDIIDILDNNGNVVVSYEYDAWGEILSVSGSLAGTVGKVNPFRYRSYYYDNESGFYYLQSRYYDAEVRRFINADETMFLGASGTVLGYNLYAYCENNPVNYVDNTGYVAANVIGAVIAGVIGAVGGAFLGKWLADRLKITDFWKRAAFIGAVGLLVGVTAAAIGYFIGPYVAKAWSVWSAKLSGLIKGTFKSIAKITSEKMSHINVSKHLWNKVMKKVTKTQIETLIYQGIRKGTWNLLPNGSVKILYKYGGQIIVITGKVVNNVFRISDAWVWNGIGTP